MEAKRNAFNYLFFTFEKNEILFQDFKLAFHVKNGVHMYKLTILNLSFDCGWVRSPQIVTLPPPFHKKVSVCDYKFAHLIQGK